MSKSVIRKDKNCLNCGHVVEQRFCPNCGQENIEGRKTFHELFVHFSSTPFDRNRLYGAIGYQFLPSLNIQLGYLAQTVKVTSKHYLQAAVFYNIDLRKKE